MTLIHRPGQKILTIPPSFGMEFFAPKAAAEYADKVLATQSANLIAYWPLWEASGVVADNLEGTAARDGTYNSDVSGWPPGTGIGDGNTAPYFSGNDFVNVYSDSLRDAFNGLEGTVAIWQKAYSAELWTDGIQRNSFHLGVGDENNYVDWLRRAADYLARWYYEANNVNKRVSKVDMTTADWFHVAITWSDSGDEAKAYYNGNLLGTLVGIGTWVGNLGNTSTVLGARSTVPAFGWKGWEAHSAIWTTPLTGPEIAALAVV